MGLIGPAQGRTRVVVTHDPDRSFEADLVLGLRADGRWSGRAAGLAGDRASTRGGSRAAFAAILAKDLRAELRTLESLPAMALFSVRPSCSSLRARPRASPAAWPRASLATVLFAASCINRLFVASVSRAASTRSAWL